MLTELQEKLAEAHALAMAATVVAGKVEERVLDEQLRYELRAMRREADETRARCLGVESGFNRRVAGELLAHANSMKGRAADLLAAWFKAGTSPLQAWSFLAMGEAAEVAVWSALGVLAEKWPRHDAVAELAAWALPIQQRHLQTALDGAVRLAQLTQPAAPRWG